MNSKRRCQFLSNRVAKKLKLCKNLEQHVNSFNMKARQFYDYVHGRKELYVAYTLCLASIVIAKYSTRSTSTKVFITQVQDEGNVFMSLCKTGVRFCTSVGDICNRQVMLHDLRTTLYWAQEAHGPFNRIRVFRNYLKAE
jgi:hypothetical protein